MSSPFRFNFGFPPIPKTYHVPALLTMAVLTLAIAFIVGATITHFVLSRYRPLSCSEEEASSKRRTVRCLQPRTRRIHYQRRVSCGKAVATYIKNQTYLQTTLKRFAGNGTTFKANLLGRSVINTVEPENIRLYFRHISTASAWGTVGRLRLSLSWDDLSSAQTGRLGNIPANSSSLPSRRRRSRILNYQRSSYRV